jgi:hypothetical protein
MGFVWGAAWSVAGFLLSVATRFQADAPFPLIFGVLGFVAGVTFSACLALAEGRRRFDEMSLPRFAGWGAAGGLLLSAVFARAASLGWGDVLMIAPDPNVARLLKRCRRRTPSALHCKVTGKEVGFKSAHRPR